MDTLINQTQIYINVNTFTVHNDINAVIVLTCVHPICSSIQQYALFGS